MKIGDQEIIRLKVRNGKQVLYLVVALTLLLVKKKGSSKITVLKFVLSHPLALTMSSLSCC